MNPAAYAFTGFQFWVGGKVERLETLVIGVGGPKIPSEFPAFVLNKHGG